jgi:hypothetical protein
MKEIIRCKKCILPGDIPGIEFDSKGVCNYCNSYEQVFSNWESIKKQKEEEFNTILRKAQSLHRPYDCLIPLSGGKDSTYTLYTVSKIYGLKCLAVTFDNGFLSNQARININNAIKITNSDHIIYHLDQANAYNLFKIFLIKTGEFCNSCMRGINFSIELAVKQFRIPLIIKGSGRRVQYVSQIGLNSSNSALYFKNVMHGDPNESTFCQFYSYKRTYEFHKFCEMSLKFLKIPPVKVMRYLPFFIGFYDYIYKPYPEIIETLQKEMGWSKKDEQFEHLDCEFHSIPFYIQTLKLENITPETLHNSGLIRQGIITRDEAMKIEKQLMNKKPPIELEKLLKKMNISENEFFNLVKLSNNEKYIPKSEKLLNSLYKRYILRDL